MKIKGRIAGARRGEIRLIADEIEVSKRRFLVNSMLKRSPGVKYFNAEIGIAVGQHTELLGLVNSYVEVDVLDGQIDADPASIMFSKDRQSVFGSIKSSALMGWESRNPGVNWTLPAINAIQAVVMLSLDEPDPDAIDEVVKDEWSMRTARGIISQEDIDAVLSA